jgi:hypothetical protein
LWQSSSGIAPGKYGFVTYTLPQMERFRLFCSLFDS